MHQPLLDRARANGGGDEYDFAPFFKRDRALRRRRSTSASATLETPMGPGPPSTYPIFNTPTELAASIRRSGWDACSTASNHSLDGGQAGIDGTVKALHKRDIEHTGSFRSEQASKRPTILERRRGEDRLRLLHRRHQRPPRAARWSVNEYAAADPKAGAKAIIRDARDARDAGADAVIAQLHWGAEYDQSPNASQRRGRRRSSPTRR